MASILKLLFLTVTSLCFAPISAQNTCQFADLAFVIDSSDSITPEYWTLLRNFLSDFVANLTIAPDAVQVGVIQYSSNAQTSFSLTRHSTRAQLQTALRNLQNIGSQTNTAEALELLVSDMFFPGNGDRFNAPDVAIVITDGRANVRETEVELTALAAKNEGMFFLLKYSKT